MDLSKALSLQALNINKSVQKTYNSQFSDTTTDEWDAQAFFELTQQKTVTSALFNEIGRLEHQSLKTTLESFQ
ncbi:hypothetical protein ACW9IB_12190 [Pseudomonas sp. SDO524_S393]